MGKTADAVIFTRDEDGDLCYLQIERGKPPFEGSSALPGGHIEDGEEAGEAILRELNEETGIRADQDDLKSQGEVEEKTDLITDPRYERGGMSEEEYREFLEEEKGFDPERIDSLLENAGEHKAEDGEGDYDTREGGFEYHVGAFWLDDWENVEAGDDAAEAEFVKYNPEEDLAFGQERSLEWAYNQLDDDYKSSSQPA